MTELDQSSTLSSALSNSSKRPSHSPVQEDLKQNQIVQPAVERRYAIVHDPILGVHEPGIAIGTVYVLRNVDLTPSTDPQLSNSIQVEDLTQLFLAYAKQSGNPNSTVDASLTKLDKIKDALEQPDKASWVIAQLTEFLIPNWLTTCNQLEFRPNALKSFEQYCQLFSEQICKLFSPDPNTASEPQAAINTIITQIEADIKLVQNSDSLKDIAAVSAIGKRTFGMKYEAFTGCLKFLKQGYSFEESIKENARSKIESLKKLNQTLDDATLTEWEVADTIEEIQGAKESIDAHKAFILALQKEFIPEGPLVIHRVHRADGTITQLEIENIQKGDPQKIAGIAGSVPSSGHLRLTVSLNNIPTLATSPNSHEKLITGMPVILDTRNPDQAVLIVFPAPETLANYHILKANFDTERNQRKYDLSVVQNTRNSSNVKIHWVCDSFSEHVKTMLNDARVGVGFSRTEQLTITENFWNDLNVRISIYEELIANTKSEPLVIRVFDYPKNSDFEKSRGLQGTLAHEKIPQQINELVAVAIKNNKPLRILFPMVDTVADWQRFKGYFDSAVKGLDAEKVKELITLGIQIESKEGIKNMSAILEAGANYISSVAIGTNDLESDIVGLPRGTYESNPFNPKLLKAVKDIVDTAKQFGITASICGQMGANPLLAPYFVSLGLGSICCPIDAQNYAQLAQALNIAAKNAEYDSANIADLLSRLITSEQVQKALKILAKAN